MDIESFVIGAAVGGAMVGALAYAFLRKSKAEAAKWDEIADGLNKYLVTSSGFRAKPLKGADGRTELKLDQVWTDKQIEDNKGAAAEAVARGIGEGLLQTQTPEAAQLVAFLKARFRETHGKEPESAFELGFAWLDCLAHRSENPDAERAQRFTVLNDAHSAAKPPA
jgi:hypothetical protein